MLKDWFNIIDIEQLSAIKSRIELARKSNQVFPGSKETLKLLTMINPEDVKIVILGRDPYHDGSADGLAFSTKSNKRPIELQNIFREIYSNFAVGMYGYTIDDFFPTNDLSIWTKKGILPINTVMTVDEGKPISHSKIGWLKLVSGMITELSKLKQPIVFMLWGDHCQKFEKFINGPNNKILKAAWPAENKFIGNRNFFDAWNWLYQHRAIGKYIDFTDLFDSVKAEERLKKHAQVEEWTKEEFDSNLKVIQEFQPELTTESAYSLFTTNSKINA